jgi:hypothetical protein
VIQYPKKVIAIVAGQKVIDYIKNHRYGVKDLSGEKKQYF